MRTPCTTFRSILAGCFLSLFLTPSLLAQVIEPPEDPSELALLPLAFTMDNEDIDWEGFTFFPFEGAALERVENPDQSGISESDYVLQYVKAAGPWWAGFFYHTDEVVEITDDAEFRLKVWSNVADIRAIAKFELKQFRDVSTGDLFADVTVAGEWTELVWDVSGVDRDTPWDRVVIIMDAEGPDGAGGERFTWYLDDFRVGADDPVSVNKGSDVPRLLELDQNFPNPFSSDTEIRYSLGQASHATLEVFDLLGQKVATLVDEVVPQGRHATRFDASDLAAGVYIYRLHAGGEVQSRVLTLMK